MFLIRPRRKCLHLRFLISSFYFLSSIIQTLLNRFPWIWCKGETGATLTVHDRAFFKFSPISSGNNSWIFRFQSKYHFISYLKNETGHLLPIMIWTHFVNLWQLNGLVSSWNCCRAHIIVCLCLLWHFTRSLWNRILHCLPDRLCDFENQSITLFFKPFLSLWGSSVVVWHLFVVVTK